MTISPSLPWFRLDLRLADNPALDAAIKRGGAVIPIFTHAPEEEAPPEILARAGVEPDRTYPRPMVSHAIAREVALEAFAKIQGGKHQE